MNMNKIKVREILKKKIQVYWMIKVKNIHKIQMMMSNNKKMKKILNKMAIKVKINNKI